MRRWKRFAWREILTIAGVSFSTLMIALTVAGPVAPGLWDLFGEAIPALVVTAIIATVSAGVLNAGNLRSDPWKQRDRRFEHLAAWWIAIVLLGLSLTIILSTTVLARYLSTHVYFPALLPAFLGFTWLLFRRRQDASTVESAAPGIGAQIHDARFPDDVRAGAFREAVRSAASKEDELRRIIPPLLEQPAGPVLESAIFAVLEECRDVAAVESLLISSLTQSSAVASVRVAHLLAWFGTAAAIEPLTKVTGPGADAATAAISRIRTRVHGDAGALSIASGVDEGRLSIAAHAGALTVAKPIGS